MFIRLREYLNHHKWNVDRNKNIKGTAVESSEGKEENIIGNWRKRDPYNIVAEDCGIISYSYVERECVSNEPESLGEEISKQYVQSRA